MKKIFIIIALSLFLGFPLIARASVSYYCLKEKTAECKDVGKTDDISKVNCPSGYFAATEGTCAEAIKAADNQTKKATTKCASDPTRECVSLENPIEATDVPTLLGTIIKAALGVVGSLTLLMLVWGGFQWLTSAGNAERVKKGTQTMVWAVVGVVLVFTSYLILSTFTDYLTGKK